MRKLILPLFAVAFLASAPAYADTMNGKIKTLDAKKHMLTLDDGSQFTLDKSVNTKGLKTGEQVTVTFNTKDNKMTATKVEPAKQ